MSNFKKVTKASKNDGNKFTIRASELDLVGKFQVGTKIVLTFGGNQGKSYDVVVTATRRGTTFYGECPRGLRMPAVGRPQRYFLLNKSTVVKYV